jgi:hypothetical protein
LSVSRTAAAGVTASFQAPRSESKLKRLKSNERREVHVIREQSD